MGFRDHAGGNEELLTSLPNGTPVYGGDDRSMYLDLVACSKVLIDITLQFLA